MAITSKMLSGAMVGSSQTNTPNPLVTGASAAVKTATQPTSFTGAKTTPGFTGTKTDTPTTQVATAQQAGGNTIVRPNGTAYQVNQAGQTVNVPQTLTSDYLSVNSNFAGVQAQQPSGMAESLVASTTPSMQSLQQSITPTPVQQPSVLEQRMADMQAQAGQPSQTSVLQQEQDTLRNRLDEAYQKLGTKGQRLEELRQAAGVPSLMEDLQTMNKQIAAKAAQYNQALLDNQSRPGLITNIQGRESLIKRQQAAEIGAMTAMAEAMQGNYDLAQQYIADTINVEFEDAEANIENVLAQLDINRENMTSAEKKEADALAYQMQAEQQAIQDAKEQKQSIFDIAIAAAQNGADAATLNKITSSTDIASALNASSGFLSAQSVSGLDIMDQLKIAEAGYTIDANGNLVMTSGTPSLGYDFEDLKAEEKASLDFYNRLTNSNEIIDNLEKVGSALTGYIGQYMPNALKTDERQQLEQAQRDFVNAVLRKESGAAISDSEFSSASKQYFPQPGDSTATLEQKRKNREIVVSSMERNAQRALALQQQSGGGQTTTSPYTDTPDIIQRTTEKINSLDDKSKQLYNGLLAEGIPYSFIYEQGNQGGIIPDIYKEVKGNPQDFIDTVKAQYQQLGFNTVGGDTKTASIGKLSEKYESNGNPGAIGWDSTGGTSYGAWQLAHNNALNYVNQSEFAKEFVGLPFNSKAFINKWKEVAQKYPEKFKESQRKYIEKTHYFPQAQKVAAAGVNLSKRSAALRDVVWSTAVQHGPNTRVITDAIKKVGANASDAELIKAIYERRWSGGAEFSGSTQAVKNSVYKRFQSELQGALAMLNNNNIA